MRPAGRHRLLSWKASRDPRFDGRADPGWTDRAQVAKAIQYTNVNRDLATEAVLAPLTTCVYGFDAAMIAPVRVRLAKDVLKGTGVRIATTLNFPMANDTLAMKLAALRARAQIGVGEFDFPPNPGCLVGGHIAELP